VGFWISGLYSPFRSWRNIVSSFIKAQDAEELGDFGAITSVL
jgi:hypothetical protein